MKSDGSSRPESRPAPAAIDGPGLSDGTDAPDRPGAPPPDASAGVPATKLGEAVGKAPGKTRVQKVLSTLCIYVCVVPVVFLYEHVTAPACSSSHVENIVNDILEAKILHVRKFSVALSDVKVLQHDVFGDHRCSAAVIVDGKPTSHRVEYRWTTHKNALDTVYAKLKP